MRYAFREFGVERTKSDPSGSSAECLQTEYREILMIETAIEQHLACSLDDCKNPWVSCIVTVGSLA